MSATHCPTCGTRLRIDRQTGEPYCPSHRRAQAGNLRLFEDDDPQVEPEQIELDFALQ